MKGIALFDIAHIAGLALLLTVYVLDQFKTGFKSIVPTYRQGGYRPKWIQNIMWSGAALWILGMLGQYILKRI